MPDPNKETKPPASTFLPLPEREHWYPWAIAAEVDLLLPAVMEQAQVTEAHYAEKIGQCEHTDDLAHFLRRKTRFLQIIAQETSVRDEAGALEGAGARLVHPVDASGGI